MIEAGADLNLNGRLKAVRRNNGIFHSHIEWHGVPLSWAIRSDDEEMTRLILEYSPSVNPWEESRNGVLPIHVAAGNGSLNAAKVLIEAGANVNARTIAGCTALHYAAKDCRDNRSLELIKILLDAGACVDIQTKKEKRTVLHYACKSGSFQLCQLLIEAGGAYRVINVQDFNGNTPMHLLFSDYRGSEIFDTILSLLLKNGAHVGSGCPIDKKGNTPLHLALKTANLKTIISLVNAGASTVVKNNEGETPMESLSTYSRERYDLENESDDGNIYYYGGGGGMRHRPRKYRGLDEDECAVAAVLIAGGSREWDCLPTPCPGLEIALRNVWEQTPDDLSTLFSLLERRVRKSIRKLLRWFHHYLPGRQAIHMEILGIIYSDQMDVR